MKEQRNNYRINTHIATSISLNESKQTHNCLMTNYSEKGAQINFKHNSQFAKTLKPKNTYTLTIKIEALHKTFMFSGVVMRVNADPAVITFTDIISNNHKQNFKLIDALYLKFCLLQHPKTN